MAIRAWFHDAAQHGSVEQPEPERKDHPFDGAADASLFTDNRELNTPHNSGHGFGKFVRHVMVQV